MTIHADANDSWCQKKWPAMVQMMFLTERNIPGEVSINWLIHTNTTALINRVSEMWSIKQENHDITVWWSEKYSWVHCLSFFTSTLNGTASQKIPGFCLQLWAVKMNYRKRPLKQYLSLFYPSVFYCLFLSFFI